MVKLKIILKILITPSYYLIAFLKKKLITGVITCRIVKNITERVKIIVAFLMYFIFRIALWANQENLGKYLLGVFEFKMNFGK